MRRRIQLPAGLGTVVVFVAIAGGCGGAGPGTQGVGTRPAGGAGSVRSKAVRFAECVRNNGVSAFPDPDASGALTIDAVANGSSIDTSSATFKHALDRCKNLEPAGFTGHARSAGEQQAALQFARCVRHNGVPDFPDPGTTDPLVDTTRIPSTATAGGMTILDAAMHTCAQYASAAGVRGAK